MILVKKEKEKKKMMDRTYIVVGPTGSFKTLFSLEVNEDGLGEIINMDSMQLYENIKIGTASPSDEEKRRTIHHLFNFLSLSNEGYNADIHKKKAEEIISEIKKKRKRPFLVGGSLFYAWNFLHELKQSGDLIDLDLINKTIKVHGLSYKSLLILDEKRASAINPNDIFRIENSIKRIVESGRECFASIETRKDPIVIYNLKPAIEFLKKTILLRSEKMLEAGWIEEVKFLTEKEKDFVIKKKIIGYDSIIELIKGKIDFKEAIRIIVQKTIQYIRKQNKFIRKLEKEVKGKNNIIWEDLEFKDLLELYKHIERVKNEIKL